MKKRSVSHIAIILNHPKDCVLTIANWIIKPIHCQSGVKNKHIFRKEWQICVHTKHSLWKLEIINHIQCDSQKNHSILIRHLPKDLPCQIFYYTKMLSDNSQHSQCCSRQSLKQNGLVLLTRNKTKPRLMGL